MEGHKKATENTVRLANLPNTKDWPAKFGAVDLTYSARTEKYRYGNRATDVEFQNKR
jgi:hypothetical protein